VPFSLRVKVQFEDFFVGDQLTSQSRSLQELCFLLCLYGSGDGFADQFGSTSCHVDVKSYAQWVPLLPYWWRFAQCFRRHYDMPLTKARTQLLCFSAPRNHHHLHNAMKYALSMVVVISSVYDHQGPVWMLAAVVSTTYSCWWDFWYDWGLLRRGCKNWLLRDTLLYHSPSVYYICMLLNMFLRCFWVLTISPGINFDEHHKSLNLFFVGALEVLRRCIWNVFRLENEQLHNAGEFRAIKAVPLPEIETGKRNTSMLATAISKSTAIRARRSTVTPKRSPPANDRPQCIPGFDADAHRARIPGSASPRRLPALRTPVQRARSGSLEKQGESRGASWQPSRTNSEKKQEE
jgi:hypothetical protein